MVWNSSLSRLKVVQSGSTMMRPNLWLQAHNLKQKIWLVISNTCWSLQSTLQLVWRFYSDHRSQFLHISSEPVAAQRCMWLNISCQGKIKNKMLRGQERRLEGRSVIGGWKWPKERPMRRGVRHHGQPREREREAGGEECGEVERMLIWERQCGERKALFPL